MSEGRASTSTELSEEVSDGACPKGANHTRRQITRTPAQAIPGGQEEDVAQDLESRRKKVVGEPYEGKPHVRFEVAGDGNRDMVAASEALPEETGS